MQQAAHRSGRGGIRRPAGDAWARLSDWLVLSGIVWVVALADLGGAVAGFSYWYGSTILASPWYYWLFVPDCPLAATFMGAALLAYHFGRRWHLLGLLAVGTCVKYGLWTVVSWTMEFSNGGPLSLEGVTMAVTHFLLLAQGLLLCRFVRYPAVPVIVASLYLIANDLVDYVAGQYPRLPDSVGADVMMWVATCTTAVIVSYWAYRVYNRERHASVG